METKVCRVPGGGCGHGAYVTGLKNGLDQLWNREIRRTGIDVARHFGWWGPPARVT